MIASEAEEKAAEIESIENEECCEKLKKNKDQADVELKPGVQLGSWKVLSGIDAKGFFKVSNIKTTDSQEYSLKVSKLSENEKAVLLKLKTLLHDKLCQVYDDGNGLGYVYFVLNSLGPTLEELRVNANEHKFTLGTTYSIAIQCVDALEQLHSIGFMHNQICSKVFAVKADDPRSIVLYDFQNASEIGEHAPLPLKVENLTKPFKSCVVSTPDDLESLLYLMILWIDGVLPWSNIQNEKHAMQMKLKVKTTEEIRCLLDTVPFSDTIDYSGIKKVLWIDGVLPWSNIQNKRLAMHMKLAVKATEEIQFLLDTVPFADTIDFSGIKKVLFDGLKKRNLQAAPYDWESS